MTDRLPPQSEPEHGAVAETSASRPPAPPIRFVVYGSHAPNWNAALAPSARVWTLIEGVSDVLVVDDPQAPLPAPLAGVRTVVVPLMEPHLLACPRDRHEGLIPTPHMVATLADKAAFAAHAARHGLAAHCPQVFASAEAARFPCVVKRIDLRSGKGVEIATSAAHLAELLHTAPWNGFPVLLQAYEPVQDELVIHAVCRNGRVLVQRSCRHIMKPGARIRRPRTTQANEPWPTPEPMVEVLERFLAPLDYNGPCNADYGIRADGSLCVYEINPRLGGSLMAPANAPALADMLGTLARHARPLADTP
ncbi:hypothetical protein V5F53_05755 [Xanthobacter sp. V4C-4]|uniref:hypothetical protein n=1 Tax=Xanthobacter cornucopiae TaxID=3119924 RepID=UPI0037277BC4